MFKITITATEPFSVNLPYWRSEWQSNFYRLLGPHSTFWHNTAIHTDHKHWHPWTFSRIHGVYHPLNKHRLRWNTASWDILSPIPELLQIVHDALRKSPTWIWDHHQVSVVSTLSNDDPPAPDTWHLAQADTPITWHYPTDAHHTAHLDPYDDAFVPHALGSLAARWTAVQQFRQQPPQPLRLELYPTGTQTASLTQVHGTWVEGYTGLWIVRGDTPSLDALFTLGWGARPSQGYGLLKLTSSS